MAVCGGGFALGADVVGRDAGVAPGAAFVPLPAVDREGHAAQHGLDAGLGHLVDEALRILGAGELLLEVREPETGVDALA